MVDNLIIEGRGWWIFPWELFQRFVDVFVCEGVFFRFKLNPKIVGRIGLIVTGMFFKHNFILSKLQNVF